MWGEMVTPVENELLLYIYIMFPQVRNKLPFNLHLMLIELTARTQTLWQIEKTFHSLLSIDRDIYNVSKTTA